MMVLRAKPLLKLQMTVGVKRLAGRLYFTKDNRNRSMIESCCILVIVMVIMWLTCTPKPNRKEVAVARARMSGRAP